MFTINKVQFYNNSVPLNNFLLNLMDPACQYHVIIYIMQFLMAICLLNIFLEKRISLRIITLSK